MPTLSFTVSPQRRLARDLISEVTSAVLPRRIDVALVVRLKR